MKNIKTAILLLGLVEWDVIYKNIVRDIIFNPATLLTPGHLWFGCKV